MKPAVLTDADQAMVRTFTAWKSAHPTMTPKKHDIVRLHIARTGYAAFKADAQFERLKLIGVVDHKRNGDCWISEEFKASHKLDRRAA